MDCFELEGYYGISTFGLPGDTIEHAAARLPVSYLQIRAVRRETLVEAGYELRTNALTGHCAIVMASEPTIAECEALASLFSPAIPNPTQVGQPAKGKKS